LLLLLYPFIFYTVFLLNGFDPFYAVYYLPFVEDEIILLLFELLFYIIELEYIDFPYPIAPILKFVYYELIPPLVIKTLYLFIYSSFDPTPISTEFFLYLEKSIMSFCVKLDVFLTVTVFFFFREGPLPSLSKPDDKLIKGSFFSMLELFPKITLLFDIEPITLLLYVYFPVF
jgi:hypothetical protein